MKFSANLGFLWTELDLPGAVRAAAAAGFDAVECHWPFDTDPKALRAALDETGLPLLGLNTRRGDVAAGENGLSALPGRRDEARAAIDEALSYAAQTGAGAVHVMAGNAAGAEAHAAFLDALRHASDQAPEGLTLLIEPLNRHDAPAYFLRSTDQAIAILRELDRDNVKLMFDCYHVGRTEGDIITRLNALRADIGHIQFASVPERAAPDRGEIAYSAVFQAITALNWPLPLGAEYKPGGATEATLGWMNGL